MVAVAIGGAALIGGATSVISGNKAAKAQTQAADTASQATLQASREANELQKYMYDTTREDFAPWRDTGEAALGKLSEMYIGSTPTEPTLGAFDPGEFETSPGYQFRVDEAMKAIERSAAARGGLRSGATMDALQRQVQGIASEEYGNFLDEAWRQRGDEWQRLTYDANRADTYANRLAALAGVGQSATTSVAQAGQNYASQAGQNTITAGQGVANAAIASGNAQASSYANTGNAINQGVQNLASLYLYNQGYGGSGFGSAYAGMRA